FRYTYSIGDDTSNRSDLTSVLEGREEFNPSGFPDGSWEVRLRDIDPLSDSYGALLRATVRPDGSQSYYLAYELRPGPKDIAKKRIPSPIHAPITQLNPSLPDIGADLANFPAPIAESNGELVASEALAHSFRVAKPAKHSELAEQFASIIDAVRHPI